MTCTKWQMIVALILLLQPGARSHAESKHTLPHRGIIGEDNRRIVRDPERAWTAIGHVNIQGYRRSEQCTGTRIAPGLVLTAAHCVTDLQRKTPFLSRNIHFVAGVDRGKNAGHAVAACVIFPDDFNLKAETVAKADLNERLLSYDFLRRDLALIVLESDTESAGVIAATPMALTAGQAVTLAAFHRDRRQMLMADRECKVLGAVGDLTTTDCDAVAGSSGGPVLIETDGKLGIAAVTVASNDRATLAVPLTVWPRLMQNPVCP